MITRKIDNDLRNLGLDLRYRYDGKLGIEYSKENTIFRLFAPTATKVELLINNQNLEMRKDTDKGIFELTVNGDLDKIPYMYKTFFEGEVFETTDPYAISSEANSARSVVVDLSKTLKGNRMPKFNMLDSVIYELHIRDFTLNAKNKGKYLGVVEEKQLNYLKKLGITHVQLLPIYDYSTDSVDELNPDLRYNWGYDPVNYNVPEGSYSSDPKDPYSRINELKEMIEILHKNGIRVIMDVVYNHVYDALAHSLSKCIPNYAFRKTEYFHFSNGTGCGNDVASERVMIRKYIVDSVKYWASEFNLDGFRFDLMGILDVETMNEIRKELDKIDESIIILGEGWDLATSLSDDLKANQLNANKMPNIAFFNDDIRDGLRGSTYEKLGQGFVSGGRFEKRLIPSIKGGQGLKSYIAPNQLIQYIEAHDNNTVFDHIEITNGNESLDDRIKMQSIATSLIMMSQGIPFIHAGQEFFRTKNGVENSYKSSDEINKFDFERAEKYSSFVKYLSDLINYRKDKKILKLESYEKINEIFNLIKADDNVLAYSFGNIYIIANVSKEEQNINLVNGRYKVIFDEFNKIENESINIVNEYRIKPLNILILEKDI
ncbi:type I pullulanase [Streptobacillus moniliformis]|uniref:Pullulanase, type I n=1 Tax=Streptobacillus moniliformis (strain ATCC 14647 / DSM 12112 / NCTC 10651 / 9901) TaxID=519441 RepID=D1AX77_STRM9|nr:type I pullulanase [Streptobacillus moniliformis]ACZ00903.1 pullulanase, type I [Streptobacillus moniliformis DSM 12112]SQA13959.1 Pullulanase [Streptobacillus moniliformis]